MSVVPLGDHSRNPSLLMLAFLSLAQLWMLFFCMWNPVNGKNAYLPCKGWVTKIYINIDDNEYTDDNEYAKVSTLA